MHKYYTYIGSYTRDGSRGGAGEGISRFEFDMKTGTLTRLGITEGISDPAFLAIHPSNKYLYAVSLCAGNVGTGSGCVTAFTIDPGNGRLRKLNEVSSCGVGPCHLVVDATGKNVLVANYGGGTVACLPIRGDGSLLAASSVFQHNGSSVNKARQANPHCHSVNLSPDNKFAFVADLGCDRIQVYSFDASAGELKPHDPPACAITPGSGPRHFAFHPSGNYAYLVNELTLEVTVLGYAKREGRLEVLQTISASAKDNFDLASLSAEVRVHPSGRFVYASNRGPDTITTFAVSPDTGKLSHVVTTSSQGKTPRNFYIEPTGLFLLAANQDSDSIIVFRIHQQNGSLEPVSANHDIQTPVCIRMVPIK